AAGNLPNRRDSPDDRRYAVAVSYPFLPTTHQLERHIVVCNALVEVFVGSGGSGRLGSGTAGPGDHRVLTVVSAPSAAAGIPAAAKQDDVIADDFRHVPFLAVLVIPTAGLHAAFDVNLLALQEIVGEVLAAPKYAVVPLGFLFPFA